VEDGMKKEWVELEAPTTGTFVWRWYTAGGILYRAELVTGTRAYYVWSDDTLADGNWIGPQYLPEHITSVEDAQKYIEVLIRMGG
jgi:hypothetical protein